LLNSVEIVKLIAVFVIIVIALYAIYYYLNRFGGKLVGKHIKILESRAIGKDRFLILAHVEDTLFLLSSEESGVKVLKEWKREKLEKEDKQEDKVA